MIRTAIRYLMCVMAVLSVIVMVASPLAVADGLPQDELDALDNWGNWVPDQGGCSGGASGVTALVGNDNEQKAFNFFIQKGLTPIQAAGFVGNLMGESSVRPNADQLKGTADAPTANDGFGIVQWTTPGRQASLVNYAQKAGASVTDLGLQLDFAWHEFTTSYKADYDALTTATDTQTATNDVMQHYEAPKYPATDLPIRTNFANQIIKSYGGGAGGGKDVGTTGTTGTSSCNISVDCTSGTDAATPGDTTGGKAADKKPSDVASQDLSQVRQQVVCIAQQELALWKAQPGYSSPYPNFDYAAKGFLKYSDGNYEFWCADFVSWVYNQAGYPFSGGSSGGWRIPGVINIQSLGEKEGNFHWHGSGYTPKPGDIAIHGGDHTNIFISSSGGVATYIGGDQSGVAEPSGTYGTESPQSGSIVSIETGSGYYSNGITGYVSPD